MTGLDPEPPAGTAAIAAARAALAARPDEARALFTLATLMLRQGDPEATALLPRLERHPAFFGGWLAIGEALLGCDKVAAALAAIARGLRGITTLSGAQAARAHDLHGQALAAGGQTKAALLAFRQSVERDPQHAEGWYRMGLLHQDLGAHDAAAHAYRTALSVRRDFHEAAFNLGVALCECRQLEPALNAYAHALSLRPESFGRIAQSLTSGRTGLVVLDPAGLRRRIEGRRRLS